MVVLGVTFLVAAVLFALLTRRLRWLTSEVAALRFGTNAEHGGGSSVPTAKDEIAALEAAFADMSGRIGSQVQKLEQADINRREAVSNVSHDLRTPLAALQGYLETLLIMVGTLTLEEQRVYLTSALRHAERLGKLVAALFELAKLDSREMQLAREEFSLGELVQDVTQQFDLAANKKNIGLNVHCSTLPPFVSADIGLVERALENLIENALRHTPEGGLVDVTLERRGETALIEVKDNGVGIGEEDLTRIFERSFRAHDAARSAEDDGAGLGLAITRRIAQLDGGEVSVQSTPGQGAAFTITLPLPPR